MFSEMWYCVAVLVFPDVSKEGSAFFYKCQDVQEDELLETSETANPGTHRYISKYQIPILLTAKTSFFVSF